MDNLPSLSLVDVVALALLALGMVRGYFRGLSGELAQALGLVAALLLGVRFYEPFGRWVVAHSRLGQRPAGAAAFLLTALAAVVCMMVLRFVLKRVMKVVIERRVDKSGGVLAGMLRAALTVAIVFYALNLWPSASLNRTFGEDSVIGSLVLKLAPRLREHAAGRDGEAE